MKSRKGVDVLRKDWSTFCDRIQKAQQIIIPVCTDPAVTPADVGKHSSHWYTTHHQPFTNQQSTESRTLICFVRFVLAIDTSAKKIYLYDSLHSSDYKDREKVQDVLETLLGYKLSFVNPKIGPRQTNWYMYMLHDDSHAFSKMFDWSRFDCGVFSAYATMVFALEKKCFFDQTCTFEQRLPIFCLTVAFWPHSICAFCVQ